MIAVIADDFTGAAEIGGIGLRHGLRVAIETSVEKVNDTDLLIIATNTRSMSPRDAASAIDKIIRKLNILNPKFIFKKLDSVLRGNIASELFAQMKTSGKELAVVVAGNPYFKRLIKDGIYYVEGIPLAETSFANDPEYRIKSSLVLEIIGNDSKQVLSVKADQELPKTGLVVGDITNEDDMKRWSKRIDSNQMVVAGGAGFFNSLLELMHLNQANSSNGFNGSYVFGNKSLFIFGSAFPKSPEMEKIIQNEELFVSNMPDEIFWNNNLDEKVLTRWSEEVINQIQLNKTVFVSINHKYRKEDGLSSRLSDNIGLFVARVLEMVELDDLFIVGGATASSIFRNLDITRLLPFNELDAGIIQMKIEKFPEMCVTTKPGSYKWSMDKVFFNNLIQ